MQMNQGVRFSLRKKILLIFVIFLLVPLLVTGAMIHSAYCKYLLEKEVKISWQKIDEISSNLNEYLKQVEQLSFDICFHDTVQDMFYNFVPNRFIGSRTEYQYFQKQFGINKLDKLNIYYLKTANLNREIGFSVGTTFREEADFDKAFSKNPESKTLWLAPREIETFGNTRLNIISYYQKIVNSDSQDTMGMIRIDILETDFRELMNEFNYLSESNLLLIAPDGKIISSTDSKLVAANLSDFYDIDVNAVFAAGDSEEPVQVRNTSYYVSAGSSLSNGWKLLSIIPTASIEKQAFAIRQYVAIIAMAGITFALLLCIIFSFIVTKPLHELISLTNKIRKGDLEAKSTIATRDEFGILADSFNQMTTNMVQLIETNAEIRRQENIAELLYLQSQINPHFLYNTLDSIRWTARKNKDYKVEEQIELLSNLFRYYLNKQGEYVKFSDEIQHIMTYIDIQKLRFRDEISYEIAIEERIYDLYTIKLILQPLVENAIVHGFEGKLNKGHLQISGFVKDEVVHILVQDDGVGVNPEVIHQQLEETAIDSKVFALKNINDRLKLHFGNPYGIQFDSVPGEGTCVTIRLPVMRTEEVSNVSVDCR